MCSESTSIIECKYWGRGRSQKPAANCLNEAGDDGQKEKRRTATRILQGMSPGPGQRQKVPRYFREWPSGAVWVRVSGSERGGSPGRGQGIPNMRCRHRPAPRARLPLGRKTSPTIARGCRSIRSTGRAVSLLALTTALDAAGLLSSPCTYRTYYAPRPPRSSPIDDFAATGHELPRHMYSVHSQHINKRAHDGSPQQAAAAHVSRRAI